MSRKSVFLSILLVLFLLVLLSFFLAPSLTADVVRHPLPSESGPLSILFCQVDDCAAAMMTAIANASHIKCAFYELEYGPLEELLLRKGASVLVFDDNYAGLGEAVPARHGGLMHDKFCVLDAHTVITGSTNPTLNGFRKNDNNLVIVTGTYLAQNYLDEWDELAGTAHERNVRYPVINHTDTLTNTSFLIGNYFCPEDGCEEEVLEELGKASASIDFMTFSFTSDAIGAELERKADDGVVVRGVFERRQESKYSEYKKLKGAGLDVRLDKNPATMHHKLFIIDAQDLEGATVVLGSYNPTANGNERNDENVLVVHDEELTKRFLAEFARVYGAARRF